MADDAMNSWFNDMANALGINASPSGEGQPQHESAEPAEPSSSTSADADEESSWWEGAKDAVQSAGDWLQGDTAADAASSATGAGTSDAGVMEQVEAAAKDVMDWATGEGDDAESAGDGDQTSATSAVIGDDPSEEPTGDERAWQALSPAEQANWGVLGWDETRWNNNQPPVSQYTAWDDLTPAEQQAASNLGYSPESWDGEGSAEPEAEADDSDPLNRGKSWDELSEPEQYLWGVLGWDANRWNNNLPPASQFTPWAELTQPQREAAGALGYDEASWDGEGDAGSAGRIASLKVRSQNELALRDRIIEMNYEEADNIGEYNSNHAQVAEYLNKANSSYDFSEEEIDFWEELIVALAVKRRRIAGRMASNVFQDKRNAAARQVTGLRNSLESQRGSVEKIRQAMAHTKKMQEGVDEALKLKDRISTLEGILGFASDPTKLEALNFGINELTNQIDPVGDAINGHVGTLAKYVVEQAAKLEGYENKAALVRKISSTVESIKQAVRTLEFYVGKYELAKNLESAPGG